MIGCLPANTHVWIAAGHTDMRKGFNGLAAVVQTALADNRYCGHVFVFRGRRGDIIKVPWFDGQGLVLLAKRLERGRFVWPGEFGARVIDAGAAVDAMAYSSGDAPQRVQRLSRSGVLVPRSTTRRPSEVCAASHSVATTSCSPAPMLAASVLPPCTASSERPNSMAWTHRPTCGTCSNASPITP